MIVKTSKGDFNVRFGWKALRKFANLRDKDMNQVITMITDGLSQTWKGWKFEDLYALLYVGFWFGSLDEGEECKIENPEEIEDMLDDDPGLSTRITSILVDDFVDMFKEEGKGSKKK